MTGNRGLRFWARLGAAAVLDRDHGRRDHQGERPGRWGVIERFGRPVRDVLPGIHLKLPWPLESVRQTAGPDRSLFMPIGYRLIDERLGLKPTSRQKEWLTGDNNVVELKAQLLYAVRDARKFLYGVSSVTVGRSGQGDSEPGEFALRRLAESTLTEIVGRMPVDEVLSGSVGPITRAGIESIQLRADALGLGVRITELQLIERRPLASVERAFRAVQDARSKADAGLTFAQTSAAKRISAALSRSEQVVQEARSDKDRSLSLARSKADAFRTLHEVVGSIDSPAGRRLRLEAIRDILSKAEVKVVPPGSAERPSRFYPRLP